MTTKDNSKSLFVSILSVGVLILALFNLIDLMNVPTALNSKAFSDKNFGFAAKLINTTENPQVPDSSYISLNGNLFSPKRNYTLETWFKPTFPEFPSKYVFSFQQNDDPLALLVSSYTTDSGFFDMTFQAFVGEDFEGVCGRQSQLVNLRGLSADEVTVWRHVAITINPRGDWNLYVNGQMSADGGNLGNLCQTESDFLIGAGWKDAIAAFPMEIDELRVSNNVRYEKNFTPQSQPFEKDGNTLALFDFNRNLKSLVDDELKGKVVGDVEFVKNLFPRK